MIETRDLTKTFDNFTAVDSLNLKIEKGEFFGLLGPNGAGKTTTISLLSTLLLPTKGEILIDGQQLTRKRPDLKRKISVITQEYSMRQDMNMDEIMEYQGRLYFMPRKQIKERTEELLEFCDLLKFRKRTVRKLSGGMKRKLMVCRALLTDPEILLLDEPTAGMDALSRRQMWNLLRKLNEKNLTILLTTHYMEEAQSLCNRVALMDHGKLEEVSTPSALIESLGAYAVDEMTADGNKESLFPYTSGCNPVSGKSYRAGFTSRDHIGGCFRRKSRKTPDFQVTGGCSPLLLRGFTPDTPWALLKEIHIFCIA